jgi:ribosomal protein L11 methyltransferase
MYLWRKRATARWWIDKETELRGRAGAKLVVIQRTDRKLLQIELVSQSHNELCAFAKEFGGQITKLPSDWLKRVLRSQETTPLKIGAHKLIIPAGTAFGTGEHATTALSLRMLERVFETWGAHAPRVQAIAPSRSRTFPERRLQRGVAINTRGRVHSPELVVDLGTGSGILALAAKLRGAKRVIGIDFDPIAISTAKENARLNKIDSVTFQTADVRHWKFPANIDVVTANLFSELLIEIVPKLARGRWLVLSGILRNQELDVVRALKRNAIDIVELRRRGKWIAILAAP